MKLQSFSTKINYNLAKSTKISTPNNYRSISFKGEKKDNKLLDIISNNKMIPTVAEIENLLKNHPEQINSKNDLEQTPLHLAAFKSPEIVKLLLDKCANTRIKDKFGLLPIDYAFNNTESFKLILDKDPDIVRIKDDNNSTILHKIAEKNNPQMLKLVLDKNPNINAQEKNGRTALHYAVNKDLESIMLLLQKGANPNIEDKNGKTPINYVESSQPVNHFQLNYKYRKLRFLFAKGVEEKNIELINLLSNPDKKATIEDVQKFLKNHNEQVNSNDILGLTPLHYAVNLDPKIIEFLLEKGSNTKSKDKDERTPLHQAIQYGYFESMELILNKDPSMVNEKDKNGRTALHYATFKVSPEKMKLVLDKKPNINVQDKDGKTPLHYAARYMNSNIAELLLDRGADINIKDKDGKTPLDYAGSNEIAKSLFDKYIQSLIKNTNNKN